MTSDQRGWKPSSQRYHFSHRALQQVINPFGSHWATEHASRFTPTEAENSFRNGRLSCLPRTPRRLPAALCSRTKIPANWSSPSQPPNSLNDGCGTASTTNGLEVEDLRLGLPGRLPTWKRGMTTQGIRKLPAGARFDASPATAWAPSGDSLQPPLHQNELNGGQVITFNSAGVGQLRATPPSPGDRPLQPICATARRTLRPSSPTTA